MGTFNPFSLDGKTILVTGASSGIGRGIAVACARMGAIVVASGRNAVRLQQTLDDMAGEGHRMAVADLTDATARAAMVAALPELDGVVHCAGIGGRVLCKQLQETDVDDVMMANVKAPVMLQAELLRGKKLRKGASVVFIASIAADSPSVGNAVYSASKGAIVSFARCLSLELAPRQIRVNCISPAMVWTDLVFKGGVTEEDLRADEQRYPLRRYGTPADVAHLAVYMLSDAAAWMTGSNVKITGGVIKL